MCKLNMKKVIFIVLFIIFNSSKVFAATCPSGYSIDTLDNFCYGPAVAKNGSCLDGGANDGHNVCYGDPAKLTANAAAIAAAGNTANISSAAPSVTPIAPTDIPTDGTVSLGKLGKGYTAKAIANVPNYTQGINKAAMDLGALTFTILLFWLGVQTVMGEKINWMKEFMWVMGSLLFFAGYDKIALIIIATINDLQNKIISVDNMVGPLKQINLLLGLSNLKQAAANSSNPSFWGFMQGVWSAAVNVLKTAVNLISDISPIGMLTVTLDYLCQILTWVFFAIRTVILCMMVAVAPIIAALSLIPPYRKLLGSWFKDFIEVTFWKFIISMIFYIVFQIIQTNGGNWSFGFLTIGLMVVLTVLIYSTPKIASMTIHQGMSGLNDIVGVAAGAALASRWMSNAAQAVARGGSISKGSDGKTSISTNPSNFSTSSTSVPNILGNTNLNNNSKLEQIAAANAGKVGDIARAALNGNDSIKANALDKISNIQGLVEPTNAFNNIKGDINIGNMSNVKNKLENLSLNPKLSDDLKGKVTSSLDIVNSNMSDNNKISALSHISGLSNSQSYNNELQNSLKSNDPLNEIKNNLPFASQNPNLTNIVGSVSSVINSNMSDNNKINALSHISGLSNNDSFNNDIQNILQNPNPINQVNDLLPFASQNPNLTNTVGSVSSIVNSNMSDNNKINALNLVTTNESNYKSNLNTILNNSNYDEVINKITSDNLYTSQNPNLNNINSKINNVITTNITNKSKVETLKKMI